MGNCGPRPSHAPYYEVVSPKPIIPEFLFEIYWRFFGREIPGIILELLPLLGINGNYTGIILIKFMNYGLRANTIPRKLMNLSKNSVKFKRNSGNYLGIILEYAGN